MKMNISWMFKTSGNGKQTLGLAPWWVTFKHLPRLPLIANANWEQHIHGALPTNQGGVTWDFGCKIPNFNPTFSLKKGLLLCLPFIPHLPAAEDRKSLNITGARPCLPLDDPKIRQNKSGYCLLLRSFCFLQWGFPHKKKNSVPCMTFLFTAFCSMFIPSYDIQLREIWQLLHCAKFFGDPMRGGLWVYEYIYTCAQ